MAQTAPPDIQYYGDSGLLITYKVQGYSDAVSERIFALSETLEADKVWTNIVPAYDSLMVTFNPMYLDIATAKAKVTKAVSDLPKAKRFAFLSATDKKLHAPRHATPRAKVPAGSVGIANWQTGIYGLDSPGGWQIIGRTPLSTFDARRENPFLLKAGDHIRFVPTGAI